MVFNSIEFLLFFIVVFGIYYLMPQKAKKGWLLVASLGFYATWNVKYLILLVATVVFTYLAGICVDRIPDDHKSQDGLKKLAVALTVLAGVGVIGFFKYAGFAVANINKALSIIGRDGKLELMEIILPIGISFYVLQAMGYVIDVYRGKVKAERNIVYYGLFVCFFPQINSGPIGRADKLLPQFKADIHFDTAKIEEGMLTFAYGLFMKMVVADNIGHYVANNFIEGADGMLLLMAMMMFTMQIYCDFWGYSLMALGCGKMLQIELMQNFKQPYLQGSIRGFWRSWHISLTSWFTDYLYIPLGGNRKGKLRKHINSMIVFTISGLWHGAAWHFVIWGAVNGMYLIIEDILSPKAISLINKLKINTETVAWKVTKFVYVYLLSTIGWTFFKADSLSGALNAIRSMILSFRPGWFLSEKCWASFGSGYQVIVIMASVLIVLIIDILTKSGKDVKKIIFSQQIVYRWIIYFALLFVIICWGAYGEGIEQTQFIYFEF